VSTNRQQSHETGSQLETPILGCRDLRYFRDGGTALRDLGTNPKQGTIRQILVITDGFSNVGDNPVEVARQAKRAGVVVNVIGVVDKGDLGHQGKEEARSIADAGGGMCRIVQSTDLGATAQMVTHQTMQMTLQQVVNAELMQAMGKTSADLEPEERARVAKVMDKLEDVLRLELVVAVDTSASMKDKMTTVREALRDLSLSLQAREGESVVAVVRFPGAQNELTDVVQGFLQEFQIDRLDNMFVARGGTPTGPAIAESIHLFEKLQQANLKSGDVTLPAAGEDGFSSRRWDGTSPWT